MSVSKSFIESYKKLLIIPVIITLISLSLIAFNGIDEGIDLKGGTIAEIETNSSNAIQIQSRLSNALSDDNINVMSSENNNRMTVEMGSNVNNSAFVSALGGEGRVISFNSIGPVLSEEAMSQVYWALLFAFIFMAVTIFIVFREPVPSIAVILAALCDIIIALGGMSIFGIPLNIASVGALLMLIGYSVDTDILLTTRLLKRYDGDVGDRALGAMKTGLTMSLCAISAMIVLYIVTIVLMPAANTLLYISSVLIMGLCADIITTWCMNLGILRIYMERKE